MSENLELNFINNQFQANNQILSVLNHEIATLSQLLRQKRDWINQIEQNNRELGLRVEAINQNDKLLIKYYNEN